MEIAETQEPTIQKEESVEDFQLVGQESAVETQKLVVETRELAAETPDLTSQDQPLPKKMGDRARIQEPLEVIDFNEDEEKDQEEAEDISRLKFELEKWKYRAGLWEEGVISLHLHRKNIKVIR